VLTVNFAQDRQRNNLDIEKNRSIRDIEKIVPHPVWVAKTISRARTRLINGNGFAGDKALKIDICRVQENRIGSRRSQTHAGDSIEGGDADLAGG
jgi:hypothetical protein